MMNSAADTNQNPWPAPSPDAPVHARVEVPGSKSESARALLLASLAESPSELMGVLDARDTRLMKAALSQLGATFESGASGSLVVEPAPLERPSEPIHCGLAGTVMRFLPPVAALIDGPVRFVGDAAASARPMAPILHALRERSVTVSSDTLPLTVVGPISEEPVHVSVDASGSSQFISALLLPAARFPSGISVTHVGSTLPSLPHIRMTELMLADRGVTVHKDDLTWTVEPGPISGVRRHVEPDLTGAAAFLAAAVLTRGRVEVPGWPQHSIQPGALILDILRDFGATTGTNESVGWAEGGAALTGIELDLSAASELICVVTAIAAFAEGETIIKGVAHVRGHETDRLAALEHEFSELGIDIASTEDGLRIVGTGGDVSRLKARRWDSYADHRMAHAACLVGLVVAGTTVDDVACTSKTIDHFAERWQAMTNTAHSAAPSTPATDSSAAVVGSRDFGVSVIPREGSSAIDNEHGSTT